MSATDRARRGRRHHFAALLACCLLAAAAVSAWAVWSAPSSSASHGAAVATSISQGATPTTSGAPGSTVTVSWGASTLTNGHAVGGYLVKRYDSGTGTLQTTLASCSGTITATSCVESGVPDGTWRYTVTPVIATNWEGPESQKSVAVMVDTTPPGVSAQLTPAPNAAGWNDTAPVQVALTATDGTGSGVKQITYTTDGTNPTTSGTAQVYSAPISVSTTTTIKYFATDNAGNSSSVQTQPVSIDTAAPTGGSVDANGLGGTGSRYSQSLTLHVALAKGSDVGSGLASSGSQLLRATASLSSNGTSNGACGSYGAFTQIGVNDPSSPVTDTAPADNACYRYEYLVPDNAGNIATYTSPDIKVETTTPVSLTPAAAAITPVTGAAAQLVSGSTVYYNPSQSGSFTVASQASDTRSGVAQLAFPALGGFTGGGSVTTPASGTTFTTTYAWSANAASPSPGAQSLPASDNAGATATSSGAFSVVKDSTAPAGGSLAYTGGYYTSASVSVSFTPGTDAGSGVNAASGLLERASAPLSAGSCGSFGAFATIATNPSSPYVDTSGTSGSCYEYEYLISDEVGNQAVYTSMSVVELDTQAPTQAFSLASPVGAFLTGTTLYYKGNAAGSFKLVDTLTDPVSGAASASFPSIATTGWTHAAETLSTPTGGPFTSSTFSWTSSPTNPSGYAVSGLDNAGNPSATAAITFTSDTTAPTGGSITYQNGVVNALSVPITTTNGTDGQSGINGASGIVMRASATLTTKSETCGTFGTFAMVTLVGGADASVMSGHCYMYEYFVSDNVGNQSVAYTSTNMAKVDTSGPQVTAITSQDSAGGAGTGLLKNGDELILTFNQSLATASVPTTVTGATEMRASSLLSVPDVMLTIPGITQGALDTGSGNYFGGCLLTVCSAETATFNGTVALVNAGTSTTVTLTVGGLSGDTPAASSGSLAFTPATTITDGGGDPAIGPFTTTGSFKLF